MEDHGNLENSEGKRAAAEDGVVEWESLPSELLTQILQRLYLDDAKSFHKVCKTWDSLDDPKDHDPLACPVVSSQWLVHKDTHTSTVLKFFHPLYGHGPHCIDIPELSLARLEHSNNGWLLFCRGIQETFLVNPFTNERVDLPDRPEDTWVSGMDIEMSVIFLSEPTSTDCVVFGVNSNYWNHILTISREKETWEDFSDLEQETSRFQSQCSPILHNGKLYVLGMEGNLRVFDFEGRTWKVHEVSDLPPELGKAYDSYLVQCKGKLMAVYLSYMGKHICVLELDERDKMEWIKVECLGDYMLFLSIHSSFAAKKVIEGMENKIYFPRFHKRYIVFYCLETGLFKTFGSNFSQRDLFGTKEQLSCCWMQPSASRPFSPKPAKLDWLDSSKD